MDSLARRLALSNVADLAMQQKNVEALVSALRHLDPVTKKWSLWVLSKGDSVVTRPTRTSVKTEQPHSSFGEGAVFFDSVRHTGL